MSKKTQEINEEQLAVLNAAYPVPEESNRLQLPRFGMLSKDITESEGTGKNKKIKVVQSAGTFYTESDEGEVNEEGKKVWTKKYIDDATVDVIIAFHRKQLRMYDASLEKFYSTPIYDTADQILPLYLDKQVVKRGTQAELQAMFPAVTLKGKPSSKLKDETILYVLYEGVLHQANISQSSKWEFMTYKKSVNPSSVITTLGSVEDTFGDNTFCKLTFKNKRLINTDEFEVVTEGQTLLKDIVEKDKQFFLGSGQADAQADKELDAITSHATKALD